METLFELSLFDDFSTLPPHTERIDYHLTGDATEVISLECIWRPSFYVEYLPRELNVNVATREVRPRPSSCCFSFSTSCTNHSSMRRYNFSCSGQSTCPWPRVRSDQLECPGICVVVWSGVCVVCGVCGVWCVCVVCCVAWCGSVLGLCGACGVCGVVNVRCVVCVCVCCVVCCCVVLRCAGTPRTS